MDGLPSGVPTGHLIRRDRRGHRRNHPESVTFSDVFEARRPDSGVEEGRPGVPTDARGPEGPPETSSEDTKRDETRIPP